MAIFRGSGGSGDATNDATNQAVIAQNAAIAAQTSASNASASAASASTYASAAQSSASSASTSASNAATSETNAATTLASALLKTNNLSDVSDASVARTNLGLAIGTNVQAYDADLTAFAGKTAPSGAVVGTTDTQTLTNKTIDASQLVNSSVTTAKIADANVTTAKIANNAITSAKMANGGAEFGMRNRIINGDMKIDQRNAGASVTANDGIFPVDRFKFNVSVNGKGTGQQSTTAPTGFINSFLFTSNSAYTVGASENFNIDHYIEGLNVADLGWGTASAATVTLSFWVRSSLTGTFGGSVNNSASNRSYPFSYTISAANTWEQKTVTIAGDTSGTWLTTNGSGIKLHFSLGTGTTLSGTAGSWAGANYVSATGATSVVGTSGATFYITGVQLEKGSQATAFEWRPYGTELALCKMYYRKLGGETFADVILQGYTLAGQGIACTIALDTGMRAAPTITRFGTWTDVSAGTFTAYSSKTSIGIQFSPTSTGAAGTYTNGGSLILSAEL